MQYNKRNQKLIAFYTRPHHIVLAMVDETLDVEVRQAMATALADLLPSWGGEEFPVIEVQLPGPKLASNPSNWDNGGPSLDSFITLDSFLIFHLLKQQPGDLTWLVEPVIEWENHNKYIEFKEYVKKLAVVNDAAERMIGLVKPIVSKFKKESNLPGALSVT